MAQSTGLRGLPQPDFLIGQLTDDLVSYSIELCAKKKKDKKTRFPYKLYNTYVDIILKTALTIQEDVFLANSLRTGNPKRKTLQEEALGKCVYLCHLIRISFDNGWVSEKQRDKWVSMTNAIQFKLMNWMKV